MNPGKLAQARRFYHHVYNGCNLKPEDVSYMVQALEEAYDEIEKLEHLNQMYKVKYEGLIASGY